QMDVEGVPHLPAHLGHADPGLFRLPVVEQPAEPAFARGLDDHLDAIAMLARVVGLGNGLDQRDYRARIGALELHPVRHARHRVRSVRVPESISRPYRHTAICDMAGWRLAR